MKNIINEQIKIIRNELNDNINYNWIEINGKMKNLNITIRSSLTTNTSISAAYIKSKPIHTKENKNRVKLPQLQTSTPETSESSLKF